MGCHFLLQGIFLTQGSNLCLLHCRQILYHLSNRGSPRGDTVALRRLVGGRWRGRRKASLTRKKTWAAAVRALNPNHRPPGSIVVTYCFKQHVLRAFLGNPLCSTAHSDKQSHATGNEAQCFSSWSSLLPGELKLNRKVTGEVVSKRRRGPWRMPRMQSGVSVKTEWFKEYKGFQRYSRGLYSWVERMFIFCKRQRNAKSNQVGAADVLLELPELWTQ